MRASAVIKNEKGSIAIEAVIGTLMLLTCLVVIMDLVVITWKSNLISQVSTQVARQVGVQGGYLHSAPTGFPGGNNAYTNPYQLGQMLTEQFRSAGIEDHDWAIIIKGSDGREYEYSANRTTITSQYDYQEVVKVEAKLDYEWELSQIILPLLKDKTYTLTSKRSALSEWKYDYDNWENE